MIATGVSAGFMGGAGVAALWPTLVPLALVLGARASIAWAQEAVARRCSAAVKSELRMQLLQAVARSPDRLRNGPGSGEVVALTTRGLDALDAYFARYLPQLLLAGIVPLVVIVCLFAVDFVAGLTVTLTVPLIPFFMALIGSATVRRRRRGWDALTRLSGHFLDVVAGLTTLRIFGRARAQLANLERVTDEYRRESLATLRVAFLSAFALELAATLSIALVAVGVGLELVDGSLDLRTGLFVIVLAPEAYLPLRQLGASYHASEEGLAAAGSALAVIEAGQPGRAGLGVESGPAPVPDLAAAELRVETVTVRHEGRGLAAPCEASLTVRPGEVTVVAGPSGSGKSTLVDVILGLRAADSGRVRIVGPGGTTVDLGALDRADWHRRIAWVPQHPYLFPGTVAENLRLTAPGASDRDLDEALAEVGLDELDLRTRLGEGGAGVSSGQRRRIGVARALLRGGDLLILDEPTAGLDAESEATVLAAIRAAARDKRRAVVLVAHRPAALRIADRVATVASKVEMPA